MAASLFWRWLRVLGLGLILGAGAFWWRMESIGNDRLAEVRSRMEPPLRQTLTEAGLRYGAPVYLRVLKEPMELELWMEKGASDRWQLFKRYRIANHSGTLGPKQREGDLQAPEGFYEVTLNRLNPRSNFHLSFDLGYPNAYDRHHGRTGSLIMVHGSNVSIGCFAMTDPVIEEIYLLLEAALRGGQNAVPVHCFPFRPTEERLAEAAESEWLPFWREELKPAYDAFEKTGKPPRVVVRGGRYAVDEK